MNRIVFCMSHVSVGLCVEFFRMWHCKPRLDPWAYDKEMNPSGAKVVIRTEIQLWPRVVEMFWQLNNAVDQSMQLVLMVHSKFPTILLLAELKFVSTSVFLIIILIHYVKRGKCLSKPLDTGLLLLFSTNTYFPIDPVRFSHQCSEDLPSKRDWQAVQSTQGNRQYLLWLLQETIKSKWNKHQVSLSPHLVIGRISLVPSGIIAMKYSSSPTRSLTDSRHMLPSPFSRQVKSRPCTRHILVKVWRVKQILRSRTSIF